MQTGILKFGKLEFLASLTIIRTKTFKKSTTFSAFKKTSLISYNSKIIMQKICPINNETLLFQPVTSPPLANLFSGICNKTPQWCKQMIGQAHTLLNTI